MASSDHLKQVLYNLLDNAIKFSPSGSRISLELSPPVSSQNYYRLVVQDRGEGIRPEDLSRIFNRFYRGDSSRTRQKGGGSGLGLAIAQGLMKAHRGHIEVESKVGKGSTFILYLEPSSKEPRLAEEAKANFLKEDKIKTSSN